MYIFGHNIFILQIKEDFSTQMMKILARKIPNSLIWPK